MKESEYILRYLADIKSELMESGVEKIALFGSFASNRADRYSDIDIAIKIRNDYLDKCDVWEYFNLIKKIKSMLSKRFSRKVDIYDLDSAGDLRKVISKDLIYV